MPTPTVREKINSLINELKTQINAESTPEQIQVVETYSQQLEEISSAYDVLVEENAKIKDTLVRMVMNQGNSETPIDEVEEARPMTIEEVVAKFQK